MIAKNEDKKRGDRLYPPKNSRLFWILSELRMAYERFANQNILKGQNELIDYGCGNIPYRPIFEKKGFVYKGFDFSGNDKADGNFTHDGYLPLNNDSVNYILSSQVLEHVVDPASYLNEAGRVLKPGGKLLLSTHGVWKYHPDPTDFWRWTGDGLKKIIRENGFEIIRFEGIVGPAATGIQIFQDAWYEKIPKIFRDSFTFFCQQAMKYCDKKCTPDVKSRDACVFLVEAVKRKS